MPEDSSPSQMTQMTQSAAIPDPPNQRHPQLIAATSTHRDTAEILLLVEATKSPLLGSKH
jgi:hypothetical protein